MFSGIITATVAIGCVGLFVGLFLGIAAIKFRVEVNPKEEEVLNALPGNNCGGCGFAGCSAFAKEIVSNGAPVTRCNLMNSEKALQIGEIMGIEVGEVVQKFASVMSHQFLKIRLLIFRIS